MPDVWVQVFNQRKITPFVGDDLKRTLLGVNFHSLCDQYSLNPDEIPSMLSHLEFITGPEEAAPFALLKYQSGKGPPLVIYHRKVNHEDGASWLGEAKNSADSLGVKCRLAKTQEILAISLRPTQLADLGLLLAYEVARWAAAEGQGLVYGLDGVWYRLNRHQAFLPLKNPEL